MTSDKLPAVLTFAGRQSSISMERALKQIRELLHQLLDDTSSEYDSVVASLDDLELMIKAIER